MAENPSFHPSAGELERDRAVAKAFEEGYNNGWDDGYSAGQQDAEGNGE